MLTLNQTHNPNSKSWLASANQANSDFPIQNLPFSVFRRKNSHELFRAGVAIGDQIIDLKQLGQTTLLSKDITDILATCSGESLNTFMSMGQPSWSALRLALFNALKEGAAEESDMRDCLVAQKDAEHKVAANIGDYTDFYTSIHHATNIGRLFRPENPLLPNYQWIPIAYHGRSSSIVISGENFRRPHGQIKHPDKEHPTIEPSKRIDYELEVGIFIGKGNALGDAIPLDSAEEHIFGLCLLNDWSARDIQAWEYQPLGPFLSKNFASVISPWIVTLEALVPYRTEWSRSSEDPQPIPYLESPLNREQGSIDMQLEVLIETDLHRQSELSPERLCASNFNHAYWTMSQMVTHHTVNGCNLRSGDFLGSGTMSGDTAGSEGALIETTQGGKKPIQLTTGEQRTFLEDGDKIIMRGRCEKEGYPTIGFGELSSTLLPAK
ncbi:Fumarylacetoacetase [gamma proteobacterium IMCC1989]|nr:Fumarylacetoacetase [gamma proteobacterium IMCC1989]